MPAGCREGALFDQERGAPVELDAGGFAGEAFSTQRSAVRLTTAKPPASSSTGTLRSVPPAETSTLYLPAGSGTRPMAMRAGSVLQLRVSGMSVAVRVAWVPSPSTAPSRPL